MAFLDKLTDAAAMIGDKAGDAIEVTKIKTRINGEKRSMESDFAQLGRLYYHLIQEGMEAGPEAAALIQQIDDRNSVISQLEEELANI